MAVAASLWARLGLDSSGFSKGAKGAKAEMVGLGNALKQFGALVSAGALAKLATDALRANDEMAKLSRATGLSTEFISAMRHAAKKANVEVNNLSIMLRALSKRTGEFAATGGGPAARAIQMMGKDFENMVRQGAPLEEIFKRIADQIQRTGNAGERLFLLDQFFSETGRKAVDLFKDGAEGLEAMIREAERLGLVLGGKDAKAAEQFKSSLVELQGTAEGLMQAIVRDLTPALIELAEFAKTAGIPALQNFRRELQEVGRAAGRAAGEVELFFERVARGAQSIWRKTFGPRPDKGTLGPGPFDPDDPNRRKRTTFADVRVSQDRLAELTGAAGGGASSYIRDILAQTEDAVEQVRFLAQDAVFAIGSTLEAGYAGMEKLVLKLGKSGAAAAITMVDTFSMAAGAIGATFAQVISGQATLAEGLNSVMSGMLTSTMGQLFAYTAEAIGLEMARMAAGVTATEGSRGGIWGVVAALAGMTALFAGVSAAVSRGQSTGRSSIGEPVKLDTGGDVLRTGFAMIHSGERILSEADVRRTPAGGFGSGMVQTIEVRVGESVIARAAARGFQRNLRIEGVL